MGVWGNRSWYRLAGACVGLWVVFSSLAVAQDREPLVQEGYWLASGEVMAGSSGGVPASSGGQYGHVLYVTLHQSERLVVDFTSSSVIARFSHRVLDAKGHELMRLDGGLTYPQTSDYFLSHGRFLSLPAGDYRIETHLSSPFYLATPVPRLYREVEYLESLRYAQSLTLVGMGMFFALAFYYLAMGLWRRTLTDLLYAAFILGNLLYNGAALLVFRDLFGWHWFYLVSVPTLISNVIYIVFVMVLLGINRNTSPRLFWLGCVAMGLLVAFWPLALLLPNWSLEFARYGVAVFGLYGLTAGIVRSLARNRVAYFYLIANLAFIPFALIAITSRETPLGSFLLVEHIGLVAVLIEVLLLAQVMSYQIGQVYKQNAEHKLIAEQGRLLDNLAAQVPGVIYQLRRSPEGHFDMPYISQGVRDLFGLSPEEVKADVTRAMSRIYADDYPAFQASIDASARDMTPWVHEFRVEMPGQEVRWRVGNSQPEQREDGSIVWHGFITDMTDRKLAEDHIRHMAQHDSLTELPNRVLFMDRLEQAIQQVKRQQQQLALLFVDLDDFKMVNDQHGHQVGDALLQHLARQLTSSLRASDTAARMGGDEFMVLLHPINGAQDALQVAQKIQAAIAEPCRVNRVDLRVSASIGISLYPQHGQSPAVLIRAADAAMYQTKGRGNNIHLYDQR